MEALIATLLAMDSGECRWIGRHDLHAYCRAPAGHEPSYSLVCPDAGLEYGTWTTAADAAATIVSLTTPEPRP